MSVIFSPNAITPEIISGVTGCTVNYAYALEAERLGESWSRIKDRLE